MLNTKFSPWPCYEADEIAAVTRVLESGRVNYWTGDEGRKFEHEFAAYHGARYGVALANGTVALELALYALGIESGDEVVTTPRTFIATASSVVMRGAVPVMADIDPDTQNITADSIEAVLTPRTRAIICVHLSGWPCDMDSIMKLAREKNLYVIEDCAQAHGAKYKGRLVGSFGHMAAFSFCQDKIMTTGGEGGMLLTDDEKFWKNAWAYKDHGKSWDAVYEREHPAGFRWLHETFGTNWRMTEMQAAIGRVQLGKLEAWVDTRRKNAARLTECFEKISGFRVPIPGHDIFHSYYKYYVFVRSEQLRPGWDRDRIMKETMEAGVPCYCGSCSEIYLEKAFEGQGRKEQGPRAEGQGRSLRPERRLPVARELGETSLMFLVHPTLRKEEIERTVKVVQGVMGEAGAG